MIFATAGHVDHGKTSLVRALTGVETDRLEEERRRGLTIEPGFAYVDVDGDRWGFVDVPGHHRFVSNMLTGAAGVDAALLVVAADDGVMPQTLEHLSILSLLGIERMVVAISKADLVDADRLERVDASLAETLDALGFGDAQRIPVSAPRETGSALCGRHWARSRQRAASGMIRPSPVSQWIVRSRSRGPGSSLRALSTAAASASEMRSNCFLAAWKYACALARSGPGSRDGPGG